MVNFLKDSLLDQLKPLSDSGNVDMKLIAADIEISSNAQYNGKDVTITRGSLMYSIEIQGVVFLIMHWVPCLQTAYGNHGSFVDKWYVPKGQSTLNPKTQEIFDIQDGYDWLYNQLSDAAAAGKNVVLVPHYVEALELYIQNNPIAQTPNLQQLIGRTTIAILTGHDHDQWGKYGQLISNKNTVNLVHANVCGQCDTAIPVFYAGSASYQKYISVTLEHNADPALATVTVQSKTSEEGQNECADTGDNNLTP